MSLLRRVGVNALRNLKPKAGHNSESFWSEGKQEKVPGYLFNETPLPPGQTRKWESWEIGWYTMLASIAAFTVIGYPSKPDTNMSTWAKKKAKQELREEGLEF
jgi:hypothetical protein